VIAAGFAQTTVVAAGLTVKVCEIGVAAVYSAFPAWLACTVTEPAPVIVTMFPLAVAGPEVTA
jgi:Tfp pilus assembly PilM family ATPase